MPDRTIPLCAILLFCRFQLLCFFPCSNGFPIGDSLIRLELPCMLFIRQLHQLVFQNPLCGLLCRFIIQADVLIRCICIRYRLSCISPEQFCQLDPVLGKCRPTGQQIFQIEFCSELVQQELDDTTAYIPIPDEIREYYRMYRPSPLCRAYRLEEALGTPAKIYYKFEGNNTSGSHKLNSAIAQAYYAKKQGLKCRETGEEKTIVFGLTGTGYFDMVAYEKFHDGQMSDYIPTDADLQKGFDGIPRFPGNEI